MSPISEDYVEELNRMIPDAAAGVESSESEPGDAKRTRQIGVILDSRSFRGAPLLKKFLEFIASESSKGRDDELSEYVIATQVFGRPANFDPASDTIVRTQAYRLRTKLKEYYENEGKADRVMVGVPKGHYVPTFSFRQEIDTKAEPQSDENAEDANVVGETASLWHYWKAILISACGLLLIALAFVAGARFEAARVSAQTASTGLAQNVAEPLASFWRDFAGGDREIILGYTNAAFMITETDDLLRVRGDGATADRGALVGKEASQSDALNSALAAHAGPLYYEDSFTGTGEVLAAYRLANLLTRLGINVQVKRSRLITVDDLRDHNIVFLGSPFANQVLADMPLSQRFTFQFAPRPPYLWRARIIDGKADGISYMVERDPQSQVIRADYGLFDVLPGRAPGRRILVLAGLTTSGTEGAAQFSTSLEGVRQILALNGTSGDPSGSKTFPRYFESVLRVEAEKGLEAINVKFVDGSVVQMQK